LTSTEIEDENVVASKMPNKRKDLLAKSS